MSGVINGTGICEDGLFFFVYTGVYKKIGIHWHGVMVLKIPRIGSISGYWMSENTETKNGYTFGYIKFDREL